MRRDEERLLETAVEALRSDRPDAAQVMASARRMGDRLGIEEMGAMSTSSVGVIESCDDVQRLLAAYRAGTLGEARRGLIDAHLRECGACLRQSQSGDERAVVDWARPASGSGSRSGSGPASGFGSKRAEALGGLRKRGFGWRSPVVGWGLAPASVALVCSFFMYRAYWQVPPGVRAEVESIDGPVYRLSDGGDQQLKAGDRLNEDEQLRTSGGGHAVLRLADGSMVEVNERSVVGVGARGHNMTVSLDNGAVIVEAAKRDAGHLYLKTPDCRLAVTGTVFSVNSGIKGSHVAVLQGSVDVEHAGVDRKVAAGDQLYTNDNLSSEPVKEPISNQIAWSHDRERYLPLLAQFVMLQHRIEGIALPQARYSSDLLQRVPVETLLYVSIPNLGDFLSQANKIFGEQLKQSPELQQWWDSNHQRNSADLDAMVDKLHQMSEYLGEEVVVVGVNSGDKLSKSSSKSGAPGFAVVADLRKSGFGEFLKQPMPVQMPGGGGGSGAGLTVLDESTLKSAGPGKDGGGMYALVREHEVVFSNSIATLKEMNGQLDAGASGFADGDFGKQIAAAYGRGAGVILAADLHRIAGSMNVDLAGSGGMKQKTLMANSGMDGVQYLIAEHRETNGEPQNHLNLQFSGSRQRMASWLAAPAAMGSLEFVTPNASIAVAVLSKEPKDIVDDIMDMAALDKEAQQKDWDQANRMLDVNLRNDLAANVGGEFLLSLDGPVLPMPAWKAVIEVHDAARLEKTLEQVAAAVGKSMAAGQTQRGRGMAIDQSEVGSQRFYAVRDVASGNTVAHYTFAAGYMIFAPSRALLIEAIRAHDKGDSLARSASFKASLPKDENENYSAVGYQNLSPVVNPLLSQMSGPAADALRKLAADAKPTTVCAWGRDSRIEVASDSRLFGFDFLTLGALIHSNAKTLGNNLTD